MKKFIKRILLFLFLISFIFIGFEWITSKTIISNSNFKLKNEPKYVVLGHSQPEHAYNDTLIDHFKNLAEGGESYFYTYNKSKEVIRNNPSIKTVFIEFTNNSIDPKMDAWTWDSYYMASRLERFAPLINFKDKMHMFFKNPKCYSKTILFVLEERVNQIIYNKLMFSEKIGGFKVEIPKKKEKPITEEGLRLQALNKFDKTGVAYSTLNLEYLKKLIELCENNNKNVVLVRTPTRKDYDFLNNEQLYQRIRKQYFGHQPFLDFSNLNFNDSEFFDASHLNYIGSKRFSLWFNQLLKYENLEYYSKRKLDSLINKFNE